MIDNDKLGNMSVKKLLFELSVPAIFAQIVNVLYNLIDRIYIGHIDKIGSLALTGVGVAMPLIMIISAFAALAAMGGAPRASIYLGKDDLKTAEKILGNSFSLLLIISLILSISIYASLDKILILFGASENTLAYAMDYMKIYVLGTVFVQLSIGLNAFITAQGFAKTSMYTVCIGAVLNIVLDPIFIFAFKMGVKGAALATIISQAVSAIWVLMFLRGESTILKIKKKNMKLDKDIILPSIALGASPFIMQMTEGLIGITFNRSALKYGGDIAVGTMTILLSIMNFSMLPLIGLTQGAQPIISYSYGKNDINRLKTTFLYLLKSSLIYSFTLWILLMFIPNIFASLFTSDTSLIDYSTPAIRMFFFVNILLGIQIACQNTFIAIGNAKTSLFLAILRKIILLIPLIIILPNFIEPKITGVFIAEPISDFIAVLTTVIMFRKAYKKL